MHDDPAAPPDETHITIEKTIPNINRRAGARLLAALAARLDNLLFITDTITCVLNHLSVLGVCGRFEGVGERNA
jgi:hypothetical protein